MRLARNSRLARRDHLRTAPRRGDAAVMMAADLQDPPEMLGALLERWRGGAQVVWATRRAAARRPDPCRVRRDLLLDHAERRRDERDAGARRRFLSHRPRGDRGVPPVRRKHVSVFALITWLGFRQDTSSTTSSRVRPDGPAGRWRARSSWSSIRSRRSPRHRLPRAGWLARR